MARGVVPRSSPKAPNSALSAATTPEAEQASEGGADRADDQRLGEHRSDHLTARGAHRPEQRQLTGALRGEHREGVPGSGTRRRTGR